MLQILCLALRRGLAGIAVAHPGCDTRRLLRAAALRCRGWLGDV